MLDRSDAAGRKEGAISWPPDPTGLRIATATVPEREGIFRLRHDVYATELGQHRENPAGRLSDPLDDFNEYICASLSGEIVGFISITPPDHDRYSIDKYFGRNELPFTVDGGLFEIRLLTVPKPFRGTPIAGVLMYAALRWVEARGGTRIVLIGRRELVDVYRRAGMESLGREFRSGAVTFELMSATVATARERADHYLPALRRLEPLIDWQLGMPLVPPAAAFHGGASFDGIGGDDDRLDRRLDVVSADVLDAWFPPAPGVIGALVKDLPWAISTSPPTHSDGLVRAIARARGLHQRNVVPGAGLSSLIFLAFRQWLRPSSSVLILDPMYGEYQFVLEDLIGCRVERLKLDSANGFRLDAARLADALGAGFDLIVLTNPNNPTGAHLPASQLAAVLRAVPSKARVWLDETYVDFAGNDQSLEGLVADLDNLVVAKSMSKAYALSGLRVAYLCATAAVADELRRFTPPWAVSLPAQIAAVAALGDLNYYADRYNETRELRAELDGKLRQIPGMETFPSAANFVLCTLPPEGPDAATLVRRCSEGRINVRHFPDHANLLRNLRVAVKDRETNERVVAVLARELAAVAVTATNVAPPR